MEKSVKVLVHSGLFEAERVELRQLGLFLWCWRRAWGFFRVEEAEENPPKKSSRCRSIVTKDLVDRLRRFISIHFKLRTKYTHNISNFLCNNVLTRSFIIPESAHTHFATVQTDPLWHFEPFKGRKKHESVKTAPFKFCCFGGSRQEPVLRCYKAKFKLLRS